MKIVRHGVVAAVLACGFWNANLTAAGPDAADRETRAEATSAKPRAQERMQRGRSMEREYHHRLARLHRLREIAERRDATDRMAELDALEDRLRALHHERME